MLAAMFSGKFEVKPSEDGAFFIDRDGKHFRFILNYLRDGELIVPEGAKFLKELEAEAKFYQIKGLLEDLKYKMLGYFKESAILMNMEQRSTLQGWLPTRDGEWHLLFRASRDGFTAQAFHSKCDNKGPTVTIVKSGTNIFGGFTENSWNSQGNFHHCSQSFLYSLVNPQGVAPSKMPLVKNQQNAIYCQSGYGPTFGGGHDFYVSTNANTSNASYINLGNTYHLPTGQSNVFFTGARNFNVTDYEVFGMYQ